MQSSPPDTACFWSDTGWGGEMAVKLGAMDTHIVLTALWDYKETLTIVNDTAPTPQIDEKVQRVDRLIKHYKQSYFALDRLGIK